MRFGDEGGKTDGNLTAVFCRAQGFMAEIDDAFPVLLCFMRQAQHEIELDGFPAGGKYFIRGGK